MTIRRDKFQLSRADATFGRRIAAALGRARTLDDLRFDAYSSYWREMVRRIPPSNSASTRETVAIIDSGFSPEAGLPCVVDAEASADLTGEGILHDGIGHGTAIASLVRLVAPSARQVHLKVMNSAGTMAGGDYAAKVATIRLAFERAEAANATMVNASWNYLTDLHEHEPDPRPDHFCHCPTCQIVVDFVKRTNIDVFVSEGNFHKADTKGRPEGSWSCPAAAELAVPVLAYSEGKALYNTNLDTSAGVPAPGRIAIPRNGSAFRELWWRLFSKPEELITGSSFAAPLVAATLAALKMAFRDRGYDMFHLPRSVDGPDGQGTTDYDFPLELFFVPPDDPRPKSLEFHTAWAVLASNCERRALRLVDDGDVERAGSLCCLVADLMSVAYGRLQNATATDASSAANLNDIETTFTRAMAPLFLNGINCLRQCHTPALGIPYLGRAAEAFAALKAAGADTESAEDALAQLRGAIAGA